MTETWSGSAASWFRCKLRINRCIIGRRFRVYSLDRVVGRRLSWVCSPS